MNIISVIIPTYNEETEISKCILSLKTQTFWPMEIIVVDDGSTDNTCSVVDAFDVKLIEGEHKGPGASRNLGAKHAKGDILVFVDADMTFHEDYIKNLVEPMIADHTILGTEENKQIASNKKNIWSKCWGQYFKDVSDIDEGYIFRAIWKKEFDKMGGFDSQYGYGDDLTFWYKYKKSSRRVDAICYHKNPETLAEVYKQSRWIGASLKIPALFLIGLVPWFPILAIKKCWKNRNFYIYPFMCIFMLTRLLGTAAGALRKKRGINVR